VVKYFSEKSPFFFSLDSYNIQPELFYFNDENPRKTTNSKVPPPQRKSFFLGLVFKIRGQTSFCFEQQ